MIDKLIPTDAAAYLDVYPMAPLGGIFLVLVAASILTGSVVMGWRLRLLGIGFAAGLAGIFFRGGVLWQGLHAPSNLQVIAVIVAILFEAAAIAFVRTAWRVRTDNTPPLAILLIVGLHFVIMTPAMGPIIGIMGLAGVANAGLGLASKGASLRLLWFTDGLIKLAGGAALILLSPHWRALI
jgi:hypothetical protein